MKKAQFANVKTISIIIAVVGVIVSSIVWIIWTKSCKAGWVRAMTYSYTNPFSGKLVKSTGTEISELSLLKFGFSKYMYREIWPVTSVILIVFIVIAILVYVFHYKQELSVSESGITGKAAKGKEISFPFERIASVNKIAYGGLSIQTTGQENIKYRFLKNQAEMIESISSNIAKMQMTQAHSIADKNSNSAADELKKYKDLLDNGTILQEEFDAKKKQLLGL